jgi:hypothetical protein
MGDSTKAWQGPLEFCAGFRELKKAFGANSGLLMGGGISANPLSDAQADKSFLSWYLRTTAANGTTRGLYLRLYLSSGAGGEAARFFTTVENNTPADTVNGAHISLNFGSTAGNVSGLGTAARCTLHIPGRAINGTLAPVQAEIYGDAASGAIGGEAAFIRAIVDGHADLKGSVDDNAFLLSLQGLTAGAAHLFRTGLTAATLNAATTCALRIKIGSTTYYIPVATAA